MNLIKIEEKYILPTYQKIPLVITKGKGVYVWDKDGKKYLDFYGGHAVALIGHCHLQVIKAVSKQLNNLIFYSNAVYQPQRALAAQKLIKLAPKNFSQVFFCNSGTEANEAALKLAKKYTTKDEVISFKGSFHGRTIGSLSVTGLDKYKKSVGSVLKTVKFAQFGSIKSVQKLINKNTAAIILEPIQSINGVNEAEPEFYLQLKKVCTKNKIVLIFDEIQTGLGRTGVLFYGNHFGVMPDLITLAKGLAGGLPAGAVLVSKNIAKTVEFGDQGSTFGGGPISAVAINATLNVIKQKKLAKQAAKMGKYLTKKICQLNGVVKVKGKGLLLGIQLKLEAKKIQEALLENGVISGTSADPFVLRLMPPLIINQKHADEFIKALDQVLREEK